MIASAGSGASAGFGIAGPFGAAAGLALGGVEALTAVRASAYLGELEPRPVLADYLCADADIDLTAAERTLPAPSITLPVTLAPAKAPPFASVPDVQSSVYGPSLCWHALPNATEIGVVRMAPVDAPFSPAPLSAPPPVKGGGWLYRIVALTGPKTAPPGATPAAAYFAATGSRHDFPHSACRKVVVQVIWWKELASAVARVSAGGGSDSHSPRRIFMRSRQPESLVTNVIWCTKY